jgi:hypothetical protein
VRTLIAYSQHYKGIVITSSEQDMISMIPQCIDILSTNNNVEMLIGDNWNTWIVDDYVPFAAKEAT